MEQQITLIENLNEVAKIQKIHESMITIDSIDYVNCLNNEFMNKTCKFIKTIKENHHNYFLIQKSINCIADINTDQFNIIYLYEKERNGLYILFTDNDNDNIIAQFNFSFEQDHDIYNLNIKFANPKEFTVFLL